MRMVKEIQGHMRLRCSADRHAIRQHYLPQLWALLIKRLEVEGKDSVPSIIDLLDSYFLTKDDFDAIMELGIGPMAADTLKLDSQAKAAFTRQYNEKSHPLPFMKTSHAIGPPKKKEKEKPDLEEAIEESDEGDFVDEGAGEAAEEEAEMDLSKDKYVKAPKKRKAAAGAGKKGKKGADGEDGEDEAPGKSTGKGKAKAKGKGK